MQGQHLQTEGHWGDKMYQMNDNQIEINHQKYEFEYNIKRVMQYRERYIVLLDIPGDKNDINNLYCLDGQAKLLWQAEDLETIYPGADHMPYEQAGIVDGFISAWDFIGRTYKISIDTGKIVGYLSGK